MADEGKKEEGLEQAPAQEEGQKETGRLQQVVEDKVADAIEGIPEDEPVSNGITEDVLDRKLSEMEERLASQWVKMGGIINSSAQVAPSEPEPESYIPLSEMDFTL